MIDWVKAAGCLSMSVLSVLFWIILVALVLRAVLS